MPGYVSNYVDQAFTLVQQSWALAEAKAGLLETKLSDATAAAGSLNAGTVVMPTISTNVSVVEPTSPVPSIAPTMSSTGLTTDVSVVEPVVTIPRDAEGPELTVYNTFVQDAIDKLSGLFSNYMATHFPIDGMTNSAVEAWLQAAIAGGTGVDPDVERQYWERDRSRINEESLQAQDAVIASFAARRFPLPPGAAAHAVMLIQQKAQDELSKSSREVAIRMHEVEVSNVRFAVENAIKLRQIALGTAGEYIRALAISITTGQQMAISKSEIQTKLIAAAADFYRARQSAKELMLKKDITAAGYLVETNKTNLNAALETTKTNVQALGTMAPLLNARVSVAELGLKKDMANAGYRADEERVNLDAKLKIVDEKVKVALGAADSVARMAAAGLNNLHASASAGMNSSGSTSVNYSYAGDVNGTPPPMPSA